MHRRWESFRTISLHKITVVLVLLGSILIQSLPTAVEAAAADSSPFTGTANPDTAVSLPPDANAGWWSSVQEEIHQSEYHITWQERTYLPDETAAYQAPNRVHNLRTYFTHAGVRLIPRHFTEDSPPWEWGVKLAGYGAADHVPAMVPATRHVELNRIEYRYGDPGKNSAPTLIEWYVNSERGLQQGFTLHALPQFSPENPPATIALDLALSSSLAGTLVDNGQVIEFSTTPAPEQGGGGARAALWPACGDRRRWSSTFSLLLLAFRTGAAGRTIHPHYHRCHGSRLPGFHHLAGHHAQLDG